MSLILEALNKAERARDQQSASIDINRPSSTQLPPAPLMPFWALCLGLILLVIIAVALLMMAWRATFAATFARSDLAEHPVANHAVEPVAAVASPSTTTLANDAAENPFKPLRRPALKADKPSIAPEIAEIYELAEADLGGVYAEAHAEQELASVGEFEGASDESVAKSAPAAIPSVPIETKSTLPSKDELQRMWQETKSEVQPLKAQPVEPLKRYAQLPYLHQLPASFQDRIPSLSYQNHIYSAKAAAGAVIINGNTYRKGDLIAPDLRVDDITADDAILSYLNKPFKLAALSSWVKK